MFKSLLLTLALTIGIVGCAQKPYTNYDIPEPVLAWSMDNVWKVYVGNGSGSGFSVDERLFVTACHVVRNSNGEIFLTNMRDTRMVFMKKLSCNEKTDVAVLERIGGDNLISTFEGFHPKPKVGKALWGAGHGLGQSIEIMPGHAQQYIQNGYDKEGAYFASMLTVPGDSGSPVIALYNGTPLVVGIRLAVGVIRLSWTQITLAQHITYVAPYKNIQAELDLHA
jgi:S1-C subfamily serine protease